jgi:hypothetical protein
MTVDKRQMHGEDDARADRLARANINPATGLASDYLNHFNEAIMLLEMLSDCPECREDFLTWRPKTYREHFSGSHFKQGEVALEAYEAADPAARRSLEVLAETMTAMLEATRKAMVAGLPHDVAVRIASRSAAWLKPLVAHAGAVINGESCGPRHDLFEPQAAVDILMKR